MVSGRTILYNVEKQTVLSENSQFLIFNRILSTGKKNKEQQFMFIMDMLLLHMQFPSLNLGEKFWKWHNNTDFEFCLESGSEMNQSEFTLKTIVVVFSNRFFLYLLYCRKFNAEFNKLIKTSKVTVLFFCQQFYLYLDIFLSPKSSEFAIFFNKQWSKSLTMFIALCFNNYSIDF